MTLLAALTCALIPFMPAGTPSSQPGESRLLMISIDGLRGNWAAHPDRHKLELPTLGKLAERGVRANAVRSVFPSVT